MSDEKTCRDYGDRPGCFGAANERYTMDFTDVEPGAYLYWCAFCGPEAHALNAALDRALKTRGPKFAEEFDAAVTEAIEEQRRGAS
jgi:hypothetical protein